MNIHHVQTNASRVGTALEHTILLGGQSAWDGFTIVIMARMTDRERAALAYAAMQSMSPDQTEIICDFMLEAAPPAIPVPLTSEAFKEAVAEYRATRGRRAA